MRKLIKYHGMNYCHILVYGCKTAWLLSSCGLTTRQWFTRAQCEFSFVKSHFSHILCWIYHIYLFVPQQRFLCCLHKFVCNRCYLCQTTNPWPYHAVRRDQLMKHYWWRSHLYHSEVSHTLKALLLTSHNTDHHKGAAADVDTPGGGENGCGGDSDILILPASAVSLLVLTSVSTADTEHCLYGLSWCCCETLTSTFLDILFCITHCTP